MIRSYLSRSLRRFQKRHDYDTGYLQEMVEQGHAETCAHPLRAFQRRA